MENVIPSPLQNPVTTNTQQTTSHTGIRSWLLTEDHKRISLMFLGSALFFFLLGAVFAIVARLELLDAGYSFLSQTAYTRLMEAHGTIMVLLFVIPAIPATLGAYFLPDLLHNRNLPFPRLHLMSLYLYWLGGIFALIGSLASTTPIGWTMVETFFTDDPTLFAVVWLGSGILTLGASAVLRSINFVVAIHKMRPIGMSWQDLPLFAWGLYVSAAIQIVVMFLMGLSSQLLILEKALQLGLFDPKLGGDILLYRHFFWFAAYPAVYSAILPAIGLMADVLAGSTGKRIFGRPFLVWMLGIYGILSFMVWGQQFVNAGQSEFASVLFSAFANLALVPLAVVIVNMLTSLYQSHLELRTPILYIFAFLFMLTVSLISSFVLGALNVSSYLGATTYVAAQFHYMMLGGLTIAFLGGLHYYWRHITGKNYQESIAQWAVGLMFLGINGTFFTLMVMGSNGLEQRTYAYPEVFGTFQVLTTLAAVLLGLGIALTFANLIWSLFSKKQAI
ncbi:MAG TPA: cbb3-type cytochrome c oxidase subunit I [Rhodothermales bacterium]|nr:cbb3-type cytochrome c oxidase subunit I [Rhodothermales bacterium]